MLTCVGSGMRVFLDESKAVLVEAEWAVEEKICSSQTMASVYYQLTVSRQ